MMLWIVGTMVGCHDSAEDPEVPVVPTDTLFGMLPDPVATLAGTPPELSSDPPERTQSACGFRIDIKHLFWLSNPRLEAIGAGRISPLLVAEDGIPLRSFATSTSFQSRCDGASNIGRNVARFSPSDTLDAAEGHTYTLMLSDEVPLQTPTGPAWWVYPDTTLVFGFPDSELAGRTLTLDVAGWISQGRVLSPPVLAVGGQSVTLSEDDDQWRGSLSFTVPEGSWEVEIRAEEGGPYLALSAALLHAETVERDLLIAPPAP